MVEAEKPLLPCCPRCGGPFEACVIGEWSAPDIGHWQAPDGGPAHRGWCTSCEVELFANGFEGEAVDTLSWEARGTSGGGPAPLSGGG